MSLLIRSRLPVAASLVAALACLGSLAAPGAAFASCPDPSVSTPPVNTLSTQPSDSNSDCLDLGGASDGTAGQVGTTVSDASLASVDNPILVNNSGDTQSPTFGGGYSASSLGNLGMSAGPYPGMSADPYRSG